MATRRRRGNTYQHIKEALWSDKLKLYKTPSLEILNDSLQCWLKTREPLPNFIMVRLLLDVELLLSGRDGRMLKKRKTLSNHPITEDFRNAAVAYVKTCKTGHDIRGYDKNPIKTVCEKYEISRQTFYRWQAQFHDAPSDIAQNLLSPMLDLSSEGYRIYRISKTENTH